jgi:four helix bundle protein
MMRDELRKISEFKFEKLEVWQLSLDYVDLCYAIVHGFPRAEERNLKSQLIRAATSVSLNIAEGSTSQSDAEQARFLGLALRSLVETVACRRLAQRRGYLDTVEDEVVTQGEQLAQKLFAKLQAMRHSLTNKTRQ